MDLSEAARDQFAEFYTSLFTRVIDKHPHAVVTEYSWDAGSCDPCPTPALSQSELATLGADVLSGAENDDAVPPPGLPVPIGPQKPGVTRRPPPRFRQFGSFVLTRLHARYSKESLGKDLVFRAAPPIVGGREFGMNGGKLPQGAESSSINNFQARYAIRHRWAGPVTCANPVYGRWGGPPAGVSGSTSPRAATDLGFKRRKTVQLAGFLKEDLKELGVAAAPAAPAAAPQAPPTAPASGPAPKAKSGCGACRVEAAGDRERRLAGLGTLAALSLLLLRRNRRNR
jgi:hypothetical protein